MATKYPLYWLSHTDAGEAQNKSGQLTLSNTLPDDVANTTMTGQVIGNARTYIGAAKVGHLVVPDKFASRVNADGTVTLIKGADSWTYGVNDLLREGLATKSGGGSKPVIVSVI